MNIVKPVRISIAALLASTFVPQMAQADNSDKWDVLLGAGGFYEPKYEGGKNMQISPIPYIKIEYDNRFFLGGDAGLGWRIINRDPWEIEIGIGFDEGRQESDDPTKLKGLGDIKFVPTARLAMEYDLEFISPFIEVQRHLGGSKGTVAEFGFDIEIPLSGGGESYTGLADEDSEDGPHGPSLSLGFSAEWADKKYNSAFFGINDAQAEATNFALYNYSVGSGFKALNAELGVQYPLDEHWSVNVMGEYSRLVSAVSKSPIVEDKNQFSVGLFVGYRF